LVYYNRLWNPFIPAIYSKDLKECHLSRDRENHLIPQTKTNYYNPTISLYNFMLTPILLPPQWLLLHSIAKSQSHTNQSNQSEYISPSSMDITEHNSLNFKCCLTRIESIYCCPLLIKLKESYKCGLKESKMEYCPISMN